MCMAPLVEIVENKETSEFYPTPKELVDRMLEKIDWKKVETVLEPSAGKGDILRGIARKFDGRYVNVDAIELDPNLRALLKYNFSEEAEQQIEKSKDAILKARGPFSEQNWRTRMYSYYDDKDRIRYDYPEEEQEQLKELDDQKKGFFPCGIHVVHDDFLTYTAYKQYNAIVMNPPFSNGDKHLLKALEMQKTGGQIACLLNAETLKNPYTTVRKHLLDLLTKYNADIEYIPSAFADAERSTNVEVALVYVDIPYSDEDGVLSIYDRLKKEEHYEEPTYEDARALEVTDFIAAIVNRYKLEIEAGIELIKTYNRMKPYLHNTIDGAENTCRYGGSIIQLKDCAWHDLTINAYVRDVRLKYWTALLKNKKITGKLTSTLQQAYSQRVANYADYDFSEFNILTLVAEMNANIKSGVEAEIDKMYDKLTEEHSYYPECQKNRHLFTGWKTNKAWKIDKKCILPVYGVFDGWDGKPRVYDAYNALSDIERVLNFFDGHMSAEVDLAGQLDRYFRTGITKNIPCKFFNVTFYKKGTVHIVFTCPELIDRYNIYMAKQRNWLPPCYGTKQYEEMSAEEQAVVDSFQGKDAYEKVMSRPDYYLASPAAGTDVLRLETKDSQKTA